MEWALSEDLAGRSVGAGVASETLGMEPSVVLGLTDRLCSRSAWDRGRWAGSATGEPWADCEDGRWAGGAGGGAGFGDGLS
jgi:hypothetical protein